MKDYFVRVGERIQILRKQRKMNQKEFAKIIGCNTDSISNIENGKCPCVSLNKLCKIADALDCSVLYLLGEIEPKSEFLYHMSEYTGLSEQSLQKLHSIKESNRNKLALSTIGQLNAIFEEKTELFSKQYVDNLTKAFDSVKLLIDDYLEMILLMSNDISKKGE